MTDFLEYSLDKFIFKVAADRYYTAQGVWAQAEGRKVTVGVSDFLQQHNGDVAFAEVLPVGAAVSANDEFANIETIKVDIDLLCPVNGTITAVNEALAFEAEVINQDPYGAGWLAIIEANDWTADSTALLTAQEYYAEMGTQAQEDLGI